MMFEVRMPVYERPVLLKRALDSLLAQTHGDWLAVILDDSRSDEVKEVVSKYTDSRIAYRKNKKQYGAALNNDQCFSSDPWVGGEYACILEDDNYWLPGFLEHTYGIIRKTKASLLLMNQRVYDHKRKNIIPSVSTRGDWFEDGWLEPLDLRAGLLHFEVISNGGMVWKLDGKRDLVIGNTIQYAALCEACRTLLIKEPVWFSARSEAVWSLMPKENTTRENEENRIISRGNSAIIEHLIKLHGKDLVIRSHKYFRIPSDNMRLTLALAHSGCLPIAEKISLMQWMSVLKELAKGKISRWLVENPCKHFLRDNRVARF